MQLVFFYLKEEESFHPEMDFQLMQKCRNAIKTYCADEAEEGDEENDYLFECLVQHKDRVKEER